ncbi:MAG: hypothetical protein Q9172_002130 [Xanthocarpia lactea]
MAAFQAVQDNNQILGNASDLAEYLHRDISIRIKFGDPLTRYAVVQGSVKTSVVWTAQHCMEDEWTRHLLLDGIEEYLQ